MLRAATLYTVAAVLATLPAAARLHAEYMSTGLPGHGEAAPGDHAQTVYRFWLVGHQLEQGRAPWRDPYSFQPEVEPQLNLGGWPFGLPFWPLDALFGPVVAWNLLLLAGIVAAGLLAYAWLRTLAIPAPAAATGGLAFAIAPYRLTQSGGHLLGWAAIFLPLALWAFERSRSASSPRVAHAFGFLSAAALASIVLSGQLHLALGAIPFVLAYAAVRFRLLPFLWTLAGAAVAAGIGFAVQQLVIAESEASEGRTLGEVIRYSASWLDLLSRWRLDDLEQFVYVGWLTAALAIAGFVLLARGRPWLAAVLALGAVVPLLLSLGTNLPGYAELHENFAPLRFTRVPGRFVPIADLAIAALAAFAAAALLARVPPRRFAIATGVLVALVAADLLVFPLRSSPADQENVAYGALADAGPGRVLELPVFRPGDGAGSAYYVYELQAPRERPTGYSTVAPRRAYEVVDELARLDCGIWLPGDDARLQELDVRFIALHLGLYERVENDAAWFAWQALAERGYRSLGRGSVVTIYARGLTGPPAAEPALLEEPSRPGPHSCYAVADQAGAWVWGSGQVHVVLSSSSHPAIWIDGEQRAVREAPPPSGITSLSFRVDAEGWHSIFARGDEAYLVHVSSG
jgi:hypothetical protein